MAPSPRCTFALAALALAAACPRVESPAAARPETVRALAAIAASCASAVGHVQVRRAGQATWEDVTTGSVFRVGDEVRTTALSSARLEFLAGGGLELEESTSAIVDLVAPGAPAGGAPDAGAGEPRVTVREGVVRGFLPEGAARTSVALLVDVGDGKDVRLAPRGSGRTSFRLRRGAAGTEVAVTAGSASLVGAGGERALAAGQLALASAAGIGEPVDLIAFPESTQPGIDARVHLVPGLTVRLGWRPVAGAAGYRVQVARDLSFRQLVASARGRETELTFAPKAAGMYAWRVAAVDPAGRPGEFGFARRLFCEEKPPVDLLVGPADGAVIRFGDALPEVTFTWASSGDALPYRLVLARSADLLDDRVESTIASAQRARVELPGAGDYWWGVYQGAPEHPDQPLRPLFTRPRRLRVVKGARPPRMNVPREITRWGD